jgi:hypothetical protein
VSPRGRVSGVAGKVAKKKIMEAKPGRKLPSEAGVLDEKRDIGGVGRILRYAP